MPKVSVAICCYNSERYLDETIQSVFAQSYRDWELVIVNDGSTDRTDEIVKSYIRYDWPIRYHQQANKGFGAARNQCIEMASGKYVALIDHDDLCLPHRLECQVDVAEQYPHAALHFSNTEHFLDDGTIVRRQFDSFNPCSLDLSAGRAADALLTHGCFIDTESVFFRREIAASVGGFHPGYRYMADYDFFLRVGQRYAIRGDYRILAKWRIHQEQASRAMKDALYRDTVDLLRAWLQVSSISAEARKAATLTLFIALIRFAKFHWTRRRFADGWTCLREALRLKPDGQELLSRVRRKVCHRVRPAPSKSVV